MLPAPDDEALFKALNSDSSGSMVGRPPAPEALVSNDAPASNSAQQVPSFPASNSSFFPPGFPGMPPNGGPASADGPQNNAIQNLPPQSNNPAPNAIAPFPNFPTAESLNAPNQQPANSPIAAPAMANAFPTPPNSASQIPAPEIPMSNPMLSSPALPVNPAQIPAPYLNPYAHVTAENKIPFPAPPQPIFLPRIADKPILPPEPEYDFSQVGCDPNESDIHLILGEIKKRKGDVFRTIPDCLKLNRKLMMRAAIVDASEFQYASDILKEDESFVHRMLEINPEVLVFAAPSLRCDPKFMEEATYLNRNALKYADEKLLNNKIFMRNMIRIDAQNYMFASERLRALTEFAKPAFADNGLLLQYAPENIRNTKELVTIAVKSNAEALKFASKKLQENKDLKKLATKKSSIKSEDELHKFLLENYIDISNKKNVGIIIGNRMKFFGDNKIIDRNYVTKWQRSYDINEENLRLISADSRNYPISWKQDFKKFPVLIEKIEKFLHNRNVDQNTINNLRTTFFWKVKKNPQTVVFNLSLLRDSKDAELGPKFGNVTSLTAIAQKQGEKWDLSVVEVIFDSEIKIDLGYENGLKRYILWDLYKNDAKDENPKIIFKVEDRFYEYFEVFAEENNGKYRFAYRIDSLKEAAKREEQKDQEAAKQDKDDSF